MSIISAFRMANTHSTSPELPVETWTAILTEHGLTYFDLKRVAQVSKTLKAITEVRRLKKKKTRSSTH